MDAAAVDSAASHTAGLRDSQSGRG